MENNHIDELLKKYFEAETSVEEERILKDYFGKAAISDRHRKYEHLFNFLKQEENVLSGNFDERLLAAMQPEPSGKAKLRSLYAPLLKIAAIFLLLTSAVFFGYKTWEDKRSEDLLAKSEGKRGATIIEINDTYDDPELAREQLEKALALLGDKLNKGRELSVTGMEKLEVMDKAIGN